MEGGASRPLALDQSSSSPALHLIERLPEERLLGHQAPKYASLNWSLGYVEGRSDSLSEVRGLRKPPI